MPYWTVLHATVVVACVWRYFWVVVWSLEAWEAVVQFSQQPGGQNVSFRLEKPEVYQRVVAPSL